MKQIFMGTMIGVCLTLGAVGSWSAKRCKASSEAVAYAESILAECGIKREDYNTNDKES